MRRRRSVWRRTEVLEATACRRVQLTLRYARPDLSQLTDAELEALLPLAERAAATGADVTVSPEAQAMLEGLLPRVPWKPS
jgi:hypothetical protein